MNSIDSCIRHLRECQAYFERSTSVLEEEDSSFAPTPEMFSVAGQVGHVAITIDWFFKGAFGPMGFDMNFEKLDLEARAYTSLTKARDALERSFDKAVDKLGSISEPVLAEPLPPGPVLGGEPTVSIIPAIIEHTAHHRGSLTVYARLLGKTPEVPYLEP
ncbi:MAG: DinB family protein [Planctomycetota bacterium]|jgi:uncharacterized damage-inducible protein DinB